MRARTGIKEDISIAVIFISTCYFLLLFMPGFGKEHAVLSQEMEPIMGNGVQYVLGEMTIGTPKRLVIPKIGVDTGIQSVGSTRTGAMAVPNSPETVGWFNKGVRPGNEGSAVIAGHSSWRGGVTASFDNIGKLVVGDKIYVQDEKGVYAVFVVTGSKVYNRNSDPTHIFESSGGRFLNLVTCTGSWNDAIGTSNQRLVVFTELSTEIENPSR